MFSLVLNLGRNVPCGFRALATHYTDTLLQVGCVIQHYVEFIFSRISQIPFLYHNRNAMNLDVYRMNIALN